MPAKLSFLTRQTFILILVLSLIQALALTHWIGSSPMDVGLEARAPLAAPGLVDPMNLWGNRREFSEPMLPVKLARSGGKAALYRYHSTIPRRALARLRFHIQNQSQIKRIYFGTFLPLDFSAEDLGNHLTNAYMLDYDAWVPARYSGFETGLQWIDTAFERGGAFCFLVCFIFSLVLVIFVFFFFRWAFRLVEFLFQAPLSDVSFAPFNPFRLFLFFLALAAAWSVYLACFYPAVMSHDSIVQWEQIKNGVYYDYHPVLHTLTLKLITTPWNSPAAIAIVQILLLAAVLAYGLDMLWRAGAPRFAILIALAAAAFSPRNGNMSVVIWKDVWFTAGVFILTALLARLVLDAAARSRKRYWIALGVVLGLVPLYRQNGLLILTGMVPLLPFFFWPWRRRALLAAALALLVFGGFRLVAFPLLKVTYPPAGSTQLGLFVNRVAAPVMQEVPLAQNELEFLSQIRPLNQNWLTFYQPTPFALAHVAECRRLFFSLAGRYPLLYLKRFRESTDFIYWPWRASNALALPTCTVIDPNPFGLVQRPLLPRLRTRIEGLIDWLTDARHDWFGWRPALHLYLVLIFCGIMLRRTRDPRRLIVFAPVMLNTASLLIAGASPDYRYQFPLTFAAGFLVCFAVTRCSTESAHAADPPAS